MGEMNLGDGPGRRRRAQARSALRLLMAGVMLLLLAPAFAFYGVMLSGDLALSQQAPAADILKGFDFGPVYLKKGEPCRYFISATLPQSDSSVWQTTFEVLDSQKRPVFRQDEVRIIGDYHFAPGQRDSYRGYFELNEGTGYYYFSFKADNGIYSPDTAAPPVVSFSIRQGVLSGWTIWGPVASLVLVGMLMLVSGLRFAARLGAQPVASAVARRSAELLDDGDEMELEALRGRRNPRGRRYGSPG